METGAGYWDIETPKYHSTNNPKIRSTDHAECAVKKKFPKSRQRTSSVGHEKSPKLAGKYLPMSTQKF